MNYSHFAEEIILLERAEWERKVISKEEEERARWKLTDSPESHNQFRLRLQTRREATIIFINVVLLVKFIIAESFGKS